jgi:murein DD-endopeptidase MepM/ murein hydrolase activator NlpD
VKIEAARGKRVWVFRHCDPAKAHEGQKVEAGQVVARVTPWRDGAPHAHIEIWKSRDADYRFERMEDPMRFFKAFK